LQRGQVEVLYVARPFPSVVFNKGSGYAKLELWRCKVNFDIRFHYCIYIQMQQYIDLQAAILVYRDEDKPRKE